VIRAGLVSVLLLLSSVASAGPTRGGATATPPAAPPAPPAHDDHPAAAPPPDGTGARPRPSPIGNDRRRTISLLEVRVEGLSDDVKDNFRRQLEALIDTKRYWLADRDYMKAAMMRSTKWTDGCLVGRCLSAIRAQSGAELVLLAALTGAGTSFGYVVTLVRTDTGHVLDQESDRCDVCTVNEVMSRATLAAVELLNNVPDKLPNETADQSARLDRAVGALRGEIAAHDRHAARIGYALLAIGLVGAVTGGALYAVNDSRPSYAVATATGGLAMAAGGLAVLTF
jgi:hypothetical protein